MDGVYIIHLDDKLSHAKHYIGYSKNIPGRFWHHVNGTGCRFLAACNRKGIKYRITRIWEGKDGNYERLLKNLKESKLLCPVCNPNYNGKYANGSTPVNYDHSNYHELNV